MPVFVIAIDTSKWTTLTVKKTSRGITAKIYPCLKWVGFVFCFFVFLSTSCQFNEVDKINKKNNNLIFCVASINQSISSSGGSLNNQKDTYYKHNIHQAINNIKCCEKRQWQAVRYSDNQQVAAVSKTLNISATSAAARSHWQLGHESSQVEHMPG